MSVRFSTGAAKADRPLPARICQASNRPPAMTTCLGGQSASPASLTAEPYQGERKLGHSMPPDDTSIFSAVRSGSEKWLISNVSDANASAPYWKFKSISLRHFHMQLVALPCGLNAGRYREAQPHGRRAMLSGGRQVFRGQECSPPVQPASERSGRKRLAEGKQSAPAVDPFELRAARREVRQAGDHVLHKLDFPLQKDFHAASVDVAQAAAVDVVADGDTDGAIHLRRAPPRRAVALRACSARSPRSQVRRLHHSCSPPAAW